MRIPPGKVIIEMIDIISRHIPVGFMPEQLPCAHQSRLQPPHLLKQVDLKPVDIGFVNHPEQPGVSQHRRNQYKFC